MNAARFFPMVAAVAALASAAEVDLFVTDYGGEQTPDERPLVERAITYGQPREVTITRADGTRVTFAAPKRVQVEQAASGDPREANIFASRGEYEPFSFLLRPRVSLEQVMITPSDLAGPAGTLSAANVAVTSVESFHPRGRRILMKLGAPWNMAAHATELFWCTIKVPPDARAGMYRGSVGVTARGQPVAAIAVSLEVLPIRLEDPPFALGFNYSSPKDPRALAAHLADMREHGMTAVAPLYDFHLPVHDTDTSEFGAFIEAYRQAGFPAPLYFATPMGLQLSDLAGYGDETGKRWQQKYLQVMTLLQAEVEKHQVPVLMSIGDELTNKGIEGVAIAERLARFVWEELPEIATTSDMNGYREVMAMAPYLNVATFNNGWDGIDHHNKGRQLINKDFLRELRDKTGAIPWFVNAGSERFPFGFFFWKMTKHGVRGKVEWYYNLRNEEGSLVRTDGATVYPTLDYERCREGVDDLKYLCALERAVARARAAGKAVREREAAEALLAKIADGIVDDWTAYGGGGERFPADGFEVMSPEKAARMGSFDAIRRAIADRIVELERALE
jgi:hypothetical protein